MDDRFPLTITTIAVRTFIPWCAEVIVVVANDFSNLPIDKSNEFDGVRIGDTAAGPLTAEGFFESSDPSEIIQQIVAGNDIGEPREFLGISDTHRTLGEVGAIIEVGHANRGHSEFVSILNVRFGDLASQRIVLENDIGETLPKAIGSGSVRDDQRCTIPGKTGCCFVGSIIGG